VFEWLRSNSPFERSQVQNLLTLFSISLIFDCFLAGENWPT
jgi:hypothetical protein